MVKVRFPDGANVGFPDGAEAWIDAGAPWKSKTPGLAEFLELLFESGVDSLHCHAGLDNPRRGMVPYLEREFGAVVVRNDPMRADPGVVY